MGLGDFVKKASKSFGKVTQKVVDPLNLTRGGIEKAASGGGISDLLFGREAKASKSGFLPLDKLQVQALGRYKDLMNTNTGALAEGQIERNEQGLRQAVADTERRARDIVAQRGLGSSAVGINALLSPSRDLAERIGQNRAMLPALKYDMNLRNLEAAEGGIQRILGSRYYQQGTPGGQRQGGIAGLIGAGIGAKYGGPQGAMAGYQLGNAAGNYA